MPDKFNQYVAQFENLNRVGSFLASNPNVSKFTFGIGAPTSQNNMGSSYSSPEVDVEDDRSTLTLLKVFSFIALFIAFMGLFGLVSFYMVQKTKEIGIRKILGASESGLILLLTRWQVVILVFATVIGGVVSWYYTEEWLSTYVYRIEYPYWVFPAVFVLLLVLNFITIFFHVYKTARANPVDAIKYE